ncbi:dnaJ homolog subfamily C member 10-like [Pectinophora gossypiella]|uniref:dnaJ homolog subfamily C member 10-like n=1 Tax=Pectinophora gossypiella TaxID=13191 RepID=UPI00214F1133|nr:dnaJ homolog subfamily C member 10-like [Pectinophora gossypiella]
MSSALAKLQGLGQKVKKLDHHDCRTLQVNMPTPSSVDVEFSNITLTVSDGIRSKNKKTILKGVSGRFRSGELAAIMGPSGAGKSSLMNALTGFCTTGVSGTISAGDSVCELGGKKTSLRSLQSYRKKSCYILQDDRLNPLFTVGELMKFAADMKLGHTFTEKLKYTVIHEILDTLGLSGTEMTRCCNLSGGQRKRLSIAVELIDNPPVIYLDEPTTGLDSLTSGQCIEMLKNLARNGRTIVCTIHQPSASVYTIFDQVYILAEGMCIYNDSSANTVPYLATLGFQCPMYHNPADYILEIANKEYGNFNELLAQKVRLSDRSEKPRLPPASVDESDAFQCGKISIIVRPPHEVYRFTTLVKRCLLQQYRDWTVTHLKVVLHIVIGVLLGLFYEKAGNDGSKTINNMGFLIISAAYLCYTSLMPAVLRFPAELPVLKKENFNNWYKLSTYYAAVLLTGIPIQIWYSFVYSVPSYFLSGQPLELSRFFMFVMVLAHITLLADAVGNVIGTLVNPINGTFFGAITTCAMIVFAGFLVLLQHMSPAMRIISYFSFLRYAFEALVLSVYAFGRQPLECPDTKLYCHLRLKIFFLSFLLLKTVNLTDVTYYEILGISKQASTQEIRQAYKKLAVKFHPDKNPGEAEQEKFLKITEAYETLKDPDKRHKYDVYGSYQSYTRKYDYHSQTEYNNLFYNGLYHDDPFVDTLSSGSFYTYLKEGFHFINFYSPFCPPCQNLVDHWKKLAEMYKGIVKIAAVNCKYYNNFCYNSMRIGSYPTLLFYPYGRKGSYIYYRGERTIDALDQFVMTYIKNQIHVPVITQIRSSDKPIAYVLGSNRIEDNALTRIAYHLKGLVTVAVVEDDGLRAKLTKDEYTTMVFKFKGTTKEIESTEERDILKEIVAALPKVELIDPERLKKIRNQLRSGHQTPWVIYFSSKENDQERLTLHQMIVSHPDMHFGEIDCDTWNELCASLQVEETPDWGVLKPGGAYQRVTKPGLVSLAVTAVRLHSLSATELERILAGDAGTWVLAVVPYKLSWDHIAEPFTQVSLHFADTDDDISFGIMVCTLNTDKYCRQVASDQPAILVQSGHQRHYYSGRVQETELLEFIDLLLDTQDMELNEQQILEIMSPQRSHTWVVAFLPAHCGRLCDDLLHQWRLVANKLRPLGFVRVGAMQCAHYTGGFCSNVRAPTARLYPFASGQHYTVSLQHLGQAPYMLEWALEYIDDSVLKLTWQTFSRHVIAEELTPTSGKKPWLVYFHSPRCFRCYEMYADFAIAGILLNNAVQLGKVNCMNERGLCQHEQITSYPSLRLYLGRNHQHRFSSVISIPVKEYTSMLEEIKPHLRKYDPHLLAEIDDIRVRSHGFHDEF